jgi:hypothetical protein
MKGIVAYILSKAYTNQAIQEAVIEGVKNYNLLENKPKINDVVLQGDKTLDELGVQPKGNYADEILTNSEIEELLEE